MISSPAAAAPTTDSRLRRAAYLSNIADTSSDEAQSAGSVLDDALSPADLGASQALEWALNQGLPRPDRATVLGDSERRMALSRDAAAALARLFVMPMLSLELSPDPGDTATTSWDTNGWSWSVAVPGFGHAQHGGWPAVPTSETPFADLDRADRPLAPAPATSSWLRSAIDYLRSNRQWLLTAATALVLLLAIGNGLSKRG